MSRRRASGPPSGMPPELVEFSPADWSDDPHDLLDWYYFGRHRWLDAQSAWLAGDDLVSTSKTPRPVAGVSVNTSPISEDRLGVNPARVNRADVERRARPIKLH